MDVDTAIHEAKALDTITEAFARLEDDDRREIGRGLMLTGTEPDGTHTLPYFIGLMVWPQMRPQTLYQLRQAALDGQCGIVAKELPTEDPWGIVARALIELQSHADAGDLIGELPDPTFEPRRP